MIVMQPHRSGNDADDDLESSQSLQCYCSIRNDVASSSYNGCHASSPHFRCDALAPYTNCDVTSSQ